MRRFALPQLADRDRRTLLIGLVVILILVLGFRGIPAWRVWTKGHRDAARELFERVAMARAAAIDTMAAGRLDSLMKLHVAIEPALLAGNTPVQAGATLASFLADEANLAGVKLGAVTLTLDTLSVGPFLRPRARVDVTGDIQGIVDLLYLLEISTEPMLAVRHLALTPADPAAPADRAEVLRGSLEIEGMARRGGLP